MLTTHQPSQVTIGSLIFADFNDHVRALASHNYRYLPLLWVGG